MKKVIFLWILICLGSMCFAQNVIEELISYIGNPLPEGFRRSGLNSYVDDNKNIGLNVRNGVVFAAHIVNLFNNVGLANSWVAQYFEYFEENGWEIVGHDSVKGTSYYKNGIVAQLGRAERRADGFISNGISIMLMNSIENR